MFFFFWLISVIEARDNEGGVPRVVERWGEPDSSKCVLIASMVDRQYDPVSTSLRYFHDFILVVL